METLLTKTLKVPLNRAEGDLEVRVEMEEGRVVDAWSAGVMYRGIEKLMAGRGPLDGLVITPRICGICGTAHLLAAAKALDSIAGVKVPNNAVRIRNLALATEHIQSDLRHGVLMFMPDFVNPAYSNQPLYGDALKRYEPFKGRTVIETIRQTRDVLQIVAILGGQWPHSSYMVPGGVAVTPSQTDLNQVRYLLGRYRSWYEERFLGCSLERWQEIRSRSDLEAWLKENSRHRDSEVGFYLRYARAIGLERMGGGHGQFLSFGQLDLPEDSRVVSLSGTGNKLLPAGFAMGQAVQPFEQNHVEEQISHSWFEGYEGGRHPFEGKTEPYATGRESHPYSWIKAPRYGGRPAETGPLAELVLSRHPLITDLLADNGPSAYLRQFARLIRPTVLFEAMEHWIAETDPKAPFYQSSPAITDGEGMGLTHGSRGALGHWVKIEEGKIKHYQIITPTAWNGSPRDDDQVRGPWEEALLGTPVRDVDNPVELGHVVRSFDPCLVCAVHMVRGPRTLSRKRL